MVVRWKRCLPLLCLTLALNAFNVCGETSVPNVPQTVDREFGLLREIFRQNLVQDFANSITERRDSVEAKLDARIESFLRDRKERQRQFGERKRARRDANDPDAAIEADTAEARQLYLKGFRERGHVPVNFPVDICLLRVGKAIFAAALHQSEGSNRTMNATAVSFYRRVRGKFEKYHEHQTATARHFDCVSIAHFGFVAVVNYHDQELTTFGDGSPVFRIHEDGRTEIVQKFGQSNQNTVHLWVHGKGIYLMHTYINLDAGRPNVCPLFRWSGYYFDVVDHMPCYNSVHIAPFSIDQQLFVAVANQMSPVQGKDTFSDIFLLDPETQKLVLHQRIYIYAVSDIAYFFLETRERREHFLVTGNSLDTEAPRDGTEGGRGARNVDQNSIVYKFVDGYFVPFQNLELTGVKRFLPVVHENGEFLLLVLCHDQPLLIYEYDGWKLVPSRIDYTGEAFAAGVSHMRVYRHIVNASVIVIANSNLFGKSINLFTPQYGMRNDLRQVYADSIERFEQMHEQTVQVNLEELYNRLVGLPDHAPDGARRIEKQLELQDSVVAIITTKALQTKHLLVDDALLSYVIEVNGYVQRVKEKMDLVEQTIHGSVLTNDTVRWNGDLAVAELIAPAGQMKQLDVKVLNNAAHKTRHTTQDALRDGGESDSITVDRLIADRIGEVQFFNGHAAESLLLVDDPPPKWSELSVTAKKVVVGGNLFVNKLIDGIFFHPSNVLLPGVNQVFGAKNLMVKDLRVNRLASKRLNSTDAGAVQRMMDQARTLLAKSRGAMPHEYGSDFDTIDADDLSITGLLNDIDPRVLTEQVLQDAAQDQQFSDKLVVDQITAHNIAVSDGKLSGVEWDNVARTTGEQQILQDLQFVQPMLVDSLLLRDRLNHIPVIEGTLQVLQLNADEVQSVTGTKTFDYVTLLNPIELQGKINGESLSKMNPIMTIADDLVLDGDYTIHGNVTFTGPLLAHNILTAGGTHHLHRLTTHGLQLNAAPAPGQVLKFMQPVFVEHLQGDQINELNVNDLVPQASAEVQYLTGRKTFVGELKIDGVVDANEINKVDLNLLNRTILRRTAGGAEQTVEGTIHFHTVIAPVVHSKNVLFDGKRMERLLRVDIPQNVSTSVRFENCTVQVDDAIVVQELHASNRSTVYGYDLEYLLSDTLTTFDADEANVPAVGTVKSFRNLTVGLLVLEDSGTSLNAIPVENLRHILAAGDNRTIIKNEPYSFQGDITVNHLLFDGSINGIPREAFCRAWLMQGGNQTFTVGQTFEHVVTDQLYVSGTLNGVTMEQLVDNAYRTDREEYIEQAVFHQGIVTYEPSSVSGLVSGLNLTSDILLKQSPDIQTLGTVHVAGALEAKGELHILSQLNGINFPKMLEFFAPSEIRTTQDSAPFGVEIFGNVYFDHDPTVLHLNGHNVQKLYGEVWLPHRPAVLTGRYHFESVAFTNAIHVTNQPINHLHWDEVEARCLSGKRPQNITAPVQFDGDVTVRAGAMFQDVKLRGLLKSTRSSPGINVEEYDKNVFRYHQPQEITGKWQFHDMKIHGDFHVQTLNGYNVETELLRNDVTAGNFTASKRFRELHVESIVCAPPCVIQEVDMDEWYANGLRLRGNQTVEGTLRIVNGVITSNLEVLGTVNGLHFDAEHLMLKSIPQTVNGTLRIVTKFPKENKIFPLVFESLHAHAINGKDVEKFLKNVALVEQNPLTVNIPVTFAGPLEADETLFESDMVFGVNVTQLLQRTAYTSGVKELASQVRSLNSVNDKLAENVFENSPVLSHFDKMKPMTVQAVRMLVLTIPMHPGPMDLVVVHSAQPSRPSVIDFYHWSDEASTLVPAKSFPSIVGRDRTIVNVKRLHLGPNQHLFVEFLEQNSNYFVQQILDLQTEATGLHKFVPLYVMNSTRSRDAIWMKIAKLDCIVMYSKGNVGLEVRCQREHNLVQILDVRQLEETVVPMQIVALDNHLILLDKGERIQIWRTTANFYLKHHQTIDVAHPSYLSVAKYENQLMLAINSEQTPNTVHHGSIEIWRKALSPNATFVQHQLILTKLPKQLQFSVLPSRELLLYTLTENWLHPLVVYRYEGVTGFREILTTNTIRQKAKRLSLLKLRLARKEVVAIVGPESTDFVEVVFV
uniref:VWFD domain-containing protein n=1 Tax=Anopheles dirus TaxID=7168 RepID=A0A182N2V7_9DIPT